MMIIKQNETTFQVYDVLGEMGVWELDFNGLEHYFQALERKKASSATAVKSFPLLENTHNSDGHCSMDTLAANKDHNLEDILQYGLPESCFFDTGIVLDNARQMPRGIITPPSVSLDVNTICNYACRWCCTDVQKDERGLTLSLQEIEERIVVPLVQRGNLTWYLVGGEPTLTPERTVAIAAMIGRHTAAYSSNSPFIALVSNGTSFEQNASLFKESGINTIQFSLSSANPEKDRYFRGCPSGIDPVQTVVGAVKAAKSHGLHCGINMVLWKEDKRRHNVDDIESVIGLGTNLEVDFIRITPAVYTGVSAKNGMCLDKDDLRQAAQRLRSLNTDTGGFGGTKVVSMLWANEDSIEEKSDRPMICRGGACFVHVNHKGDVFPCAMIMPDFSIGNVVRNDLEKLWFGANAFAPWREVVEVCPECAACRDRNYCVGKCPAYAWFKFGNMTLATKPDACPC